VSHHPYDDDDPVRRVLDRLGALGKVVRWAGSQHLAQCPAHDDNGPSLAVREGDDGAILRCHAGCTTEDVVAALGLQMRDLFRTKGGPPTMRRPGGRETGDFAWRNEGRSAKGVGDGIIATPPAGVSSPDMQKDGSPSLPKQAGLVKPVRPGSHPAQQPGRVPSTVPGSGDIVAPHPAPSSMTWVADYVYRDATGTPAFKVSRYAKLSAAGVPVGKSFFQFRRDPSGAGWTAGLNGKQPPLYHLPEVLAAVTAGEVVLVVEGEKDADAAVAREICATTSSGGAGKWRDEHTAVLAGAQVIILADDDAPGHAHAQAVYKALCGVASQVQAFLPAAGCKDLSEHLGAGYDLSSLRPFPAEEPATEVEIAVPTRRVVLTVAGEIDMARVRWGWQDRMPLGELSLIPGREGVGKSLFLAWLAAQLTNGTLPGEFHGEPRAVLYVASEDSWRYTIAPRMAAAGADLARVYRVEVDDARDDRLTLPADCDLVTEAAIEVRAAALMLDPIISLIDYRLSVNQAGELRRALEPLRRLAERAGVMVCALAHFNKTTDVDTLSRIPGARAWVEVARAAFGLAEDREGDPPGYVASQIKNNLGRLNLPNLAYRIDSAAVDTAEGPTDVGRLVWTGHSEAGIDEVLARRPARVARETSETTKGLVEYVMSLGYPVALADVYDQFPEIKRETVRTVLRRAVERGTLSNPLHGHYGPGGG